MSAPKQATLEAQKAQVEMQEDIVSVLELSSGRKVKVGWLQNRTQDKLNEIFVEYESFKKKLNKESDEDMLKGNICTRQYNAKCVAAILINNYFGLKLFWWLKWRIIYNFWKMSGSDYLSIIVEAKKKATEQQYYLATELLMTMADMWTTMTKKDAEEYRAELELVKEHQSLQNSQHSDSH